MPNDASEWIFLVRFYWTSVEASGVDAVMARSGDVLNDWQCIHTLAGQRPDFSPCLIFLKTVQCMASDHACLAAAASVEVNFESVLLTHFEGRRWHQRLVGRRGNGVELVPICEAIDRAQSALLLKKQFKQSGLSLCNRRLELGGH